MPADLKDNICFIELEHDKVIYNCQVICYCKNPEWNDTLCNQKGEMCVHCDKCGGVPK